MTSDAEKAIAPTGYTGFYGFHKYWGKKPHELLAFLVENLSEQGDTVLDPFVGSGTSARESLTRNRRFIGFDVNPLAVELTKLLIRPPEYDSIMTAFSLFERDAKAKIYRSYRLVDGRVASHYLWDGDTMLKVWIRGTRGASREQLDPLPYDLDLSRTYSSYKSFRLRQPRFFSNGRINTRSDLSLSDVLTGRAQRNLDILMSCIDVLPSDSQMPMRLCLTSASGQMTKMVFAITGRGKTAGRISSRVEVGSWVIGYWRPKLHFEVNVWNCFERRVDKLLKAISNGDILQGLQLADSVEDYFRDHGRCSVVCQPCQDAIRAVPDNSVSLVLTDPPHSDRVPYLELSELWNSVLAVTPDFDSEIVISDAKARRMTADRYNRNMCKVLEQLARVMRDNAFLVMFYNSRHARAWSFLSELHRTPIGLRFYGRFPCNYSATSVVQDTRVGGMKSDVAMVFGGPSVDPVKLQRLESLSGWSTSPPVVTG